MMGEQDGDRQQLPRRVVCAAIRAFDGELLLGVRHYSPDMHKQMDMRIDGAKFRHKGDENQGFVDQWGRWMSRTEAWHVAKANGQLVRPLVGGQTPDGEHKLYSENLY